MKFLSPEVALCNYKSAITSVIWQKRANHKTEVTRKQSTPNFPIIFRFALLLTIRPCMQNYFHVWAGAPKFSIDSQMSYRNG